MALTYYIRSWDPRSTYPTNPQEGDICYTITLDQTWAPVGGVKKDNIVKEEIYQNGAWVEQGGGGGGGSDFIVPKQTITITDSPVPIQADFSSLSGEGYLCGGYLQEEDGYLYPYFTKVWYDWTSEHTLRIEMPNLGSYGATINIVEDNGTITAVVIDSRRGDVMPGTYTFGIAPNFLI